MQARHTRFWREKVVFLKISQELRTEDYYILPSKTKNLVPVYSKIHLILICKFGVEFDDGNFASPSFQRILSTSALTIYQRILTTEAPAAHQSARHSQSSTAERTCTASLVLTTVWRMFAGQPCPPSTQQKPYQLPCSLPQASPKQYHPTRGRCCCPRGVGPSRTQEGGREGEGRRRS